MKYSEKVARYLNAKAQREEAEEYEEGLLQELVEPGSLWHTKGGVNEEVIGINRHLLVTGQTELRVELAETYFEARDFLARYTPSDP